jgi:hypothetical protein
MNLAVDLLLPDPSGDQLGGLGTEIKNDNFLAVDIHSFAHIPIWAARAAGSPRRTVGPVD